jgi:hypothetical protein
MISIQIYPVSEGYLRKFQGISRIFPKKFSISKDDFRKSFAVFLTLEWGPIHQISVFQRCYVLDSRINFTVHYKFAGTFINIWHICLWNRYINTDIAVSHVFGNYCYSKYPWKAVSYKCTYETEFTICFAPFNTRPKIISTNLLSN